MTFDELITLFSRFIHRMNDADVCQMAGLARGTDVHTLKTNNAFAYSLYNQELSKSATDNIAINTTDPQIGGVEGSTCYYLVSIDLSGSVTITKGSEFALPSSPGGSVPFGAMKIEVDPGEIFWCGFIDDLSASEISVTFYDIDTGIAPILINQAMRSLERKFNFRCMKRRITHSLTTTKSTSNLTNPFSRYKEFVSCYALDGSSVRYPIDKYDQEVVEGAFAESETGPPKLIAEIPGTESSLSPDPGEDLDLIIRPYSDASYTAYLTAYCYHPYMDGVIYTSNWWTENHPDLLLYAALVEAEPYLKNDSRVELWKTLFDEKLADLARSEGLEINAGSTKYTKAEE